MYDAAQNKTEKKVEKGAKTKSHRRAARGCGFLGFLRSTRRGWRSSHKHDGASAGRDAGGREGGTGVRRRRPSRGVGGGVWRRGSRRDGHQRCRGRRRRGRALRVDRVGGRGGDNARAVVDRVRPGVAGRDRVPREGAGGSDVGRVRILVPEGGGVAYREGMRPHDLCTEEGVHGVVASTRRSDSGGSKSPTACEGDIYDTKGRRRQGGPHGPMGKLQDGEAVCGAAGHVSRRPRLGRRARMLGPKEGGREREGALVCADVCVRVRGEQEGERLGGPRGPMGKLQDGEAVRVAGHVSRRPRP